MFERKINSLFEPAGQSRLWARGWLGFVIAVICISTMPIGCSGPGKLEATIPFDSTAAELKQAVPQTVPQTVPQAQDSTVALKSNRASIQPMAHPRNLPQSQLPSAQLNRGSGVAATNRNSPVQGNVVPANYQQAAVSPTPSGQSSTTESMQNPLYEPMPSHIQMPAPDSFPPARQINPGQQHQATNSFSDQPPTSGNQAGMGYEDHRQPIAGTYQPPAAQFSDSATYPPNSNYPPNYSKAYPPHDAANYPSNHPAMNQPMANQSALGPGSGTGHLADGMNVYGSLLRQRTVTGTEVALRLRRENELLKGEIHALRGQINQLSERIEDQDRQLSQSRDEVLRGQGVNAELRQSVAKLNVKVQDLEKEKVVIEQNADKALRGIESTLDNLLLNSVSNALDSRPANGAGKQ